MFVAHQFLNGSHSQTSTSIGTAKSMSARVGVCNMGASLYEPINVYKPVAPDIGIVDGPFEYLIVGGIRLPLPFTTRMTVVRLSKWRPLSPFSSQVQRETDQGIARGGDDTSSRVAQPVLYRLKRLTKLFRLQPRLLLPGCLGRLCISHVFKLFFAGLFERGFALS
jgi:hypothetical protein